MIFVDHANVWYQLQKDNGRIDWIKFAIILSNGYYQVGKIIFMGKPDNITDEQQNFFTFLKKAGYLIRYTHLQKTRSGKRKQKGMDILIYREIIELAEQDSYDNCILVSGDADFVEIVKKLKELGKKIDIWSFKKSLSRKLIEEAGKKNIHYIDDILDKIELKEDS